MLSVSDFNLIIEIMKNLLSLVGLIMVTTACSSGSSGANMTTSENDKEANISFVITKKNRNATCEFALCQANYDSNSETLHLVLDGRKEFSYPLSQIKDEYIDLVKNNKVSLLFGFGEPLPVVVEKDTSSDDVPNFENDFRQFTFNSILKDSHASSIGRYLLFYNGMFMNGLCKVGDALLKKGRFFFSEADFMPETTGESYSKKGLFSAGLDLYGSSHDFHKKDKYGNKYQYSIVQTFYEDDYLVIRAEDGATYRYPLEALNSLQREMLRTELHPAVSAIRLNNLHWIPIYLVQYGEDYRHSGFLWNSSNYYNFFDRYNSMQIYSDFMLEAGITLNYRPIDFFFYVAK